MKDTSKLENKAVKPKETKSAKELERERFQANRDRKKPEAKKASAFGDTDCGCGDA